MSKRYYKNSVRNEISFLSLRIILNKFLRQYIILLTYYINDNLYNSTNPIKKYMVKFINEKNKRTYTIHFGDAGLSDFTINKDKIQKEKMYKLRHSNDYVNDLNYQGTWAMHLLWNKKKIEKTKKDTEKRFDINIMHWSTANRTGKAAVPQVVMAWVHMRIQTLSNHKFGSSKK